MTDIFLYQGQANPSDVKLTDPTVLSNGGITGTGGVTFAVSGLDATALETFSGTAGETFAVAGLSGSGAEAFTGTGAESFAVAALTATGAETFDASGAETFAVAALDASGAETFTGTTAVTFAVPGLLGGEPPAVDGTAAVAFGTPAIWASGLGAPEEPPILGVFGRPYGRHVEPDRTPPAISGTASVRVSAPRLDAIGTLGISGAIRLAVAAARLTGDAAQAILGTVQTKAASQVTGAGAVLNRRIVSRPAAHPARVLDGTGTLTLRAATSGLGTVARPDAIDREWTALQRSRPADDEADVLEVLS